MIPQAVGQPNLAADGARYIPQQYSQLWNAKLWPRLLINRLTTTSYFEDFEYNEKIWIPDDPDVTFAALANGEEPATQKITPAPTSITVDQQGSFRVLLTAADKKLSNLDLSKRYMKNGLLAADVFIETEFFSWLVDKAKATENRGGSAGAIHGGYDLGVAGAGIQIKGSNVVEYMLRLVACAREQNENEDINVVMPYWAYVKMFLSSTSNAQVMGDGRSQLRDGEVKPINGMNFWWSNKTCSATTNGTTAAKSSPVFAMSKRACAFATVLKKLEVYNTGNFTEYIQGLMIWGRGLIKPECLVQGYIYSGSET